MLQKLQATRWIFLLVLQRNLFKPAFSAWLLGYLSTVVPQTINVLISLFQRKRDFYDVTRSLHKICTAALFPSRFPAFCGVLIGGATLFQYPVTSAMKHINVQFLPFSKRANFTRVLSRLLAAFVASIFSFQLLNSKRRKRDLSPEDQLPLTTKSSKDIAQIRFPIPAERVGPAGPSVMAGKTMDLTLFAVVRAADVLTSDIWARRKRHRIRNNRWTRFESWLGRFSDGSVFAVGSGIVMWAWIYLPNRLPKAYNKWISDAANVDGRLVEALRRVRQGTFVYGQDTGQAPLLQDMCKDYHWPLEWGDPALTVPIPCEMVHMGAGPSCERAATEHFVRVFRFAFATYLPLNCVMRIRAPSRAGFRRAVMDSARSSTFLATFVSLFYYTVCLARTRLGPKLFPKSTITPMMWDGGLDIGAGCIMCGWSILIEAENRRHEMAYFVAPRAVATFLPRQYDEKYRWYECIAFATSTACILTYAQERPEKIQGVFGRLLGQVMEPL